LAEYQGVFQLFDKNKRGIIDYDSLRDGMIAMRLHPKDSEVRQMIKEADASKTGSIDFHGFVGALTRKLSKLDREEEILKAFNTFDRNDKGVIPAEQLRIALTTLGDKLADKEVREVLALATGSDGNFDYERFVKIMVGKIILE